MIDSQNAPQNQAYIIQKWVARRPLAKRRLGIQFQHQHLIPTFQQLERGDGTEKEADPVENVSRDELERDLEIEDEGGAVNGI